jgi:hypothetical protein
MAIEAAVLPLMQPASVVVRFADSNQTSRQVRKVPIQLAPGKQSRPSVFIDPVRLIGIVFFCADASTIGCSDYCHRNFPLAVRSRATI